jgi:hypothetical protein
MALAARLILKKRRFMVRAPKVFAVGIGRGSCRVSSATDSIGGWAKCDRCFPLMSTKRWQIVGIKPKLPRIETTIYVIHGPNQSKCQASGLFAADRVLGTPGIAAQRRDE